MSGLSGYVETLVVAREKAVVLEAGNGEGQVSTEWGGGVAGHVCQVKISVCVCVCDPPVLLCGYRRKVASWACWGRFGCPRVTYSRGAFVLGQQSLSLPHDAGVL